jgi:osmoprotectant transport system permease protein
VRARRIAPPWIGFIVLGGIFLFLSMSTAPWKWGLGLLFPGRADLLYPRANPSYIVGEHLLLVGVSSLLACIVGLGAGIAVTRPGGRDLMPVSEKLAAIGQTFPPAAVLALSVPILGFGFAPTIAALFLYSILPILRNTIGGISSVAPDSIEAARGMGMTQLQILRKVELPLAAPVILAGVRTSVIVNVGTATIGATIGAGGLGAPIISGLVNQNPAYLIEGALSAGLLALVLDSAFSSVQRILELRGSPTAGREKSA